MKTILTITSNTSSSVKLIECYTKEKAIKLMKSTYDELCSNSNCDFNNTFFDEDLGYAQVVFGLEQTELRIGELSFR